MKTLEILKDELKKSGLELGEEVVEKVIKITFERIVPRLALEAEETQIKAIAGVMLIAAPAIEQALLKAADKIDGKIE